MRSPRGADSVVDEDTLLLCGTCSTTDEIDSGRPTGLISALLKFALPSSLVGNSVAKVPGSSKTCPEIFEASATVPVCVIHGSTSA